MNMHTSPIIKAKDLIDILTSSGNVQHEMKIGKTDTFSIIRKNTTDVSRKMLNVRDIDTGLDFEYATALAHKADCLQLLLDWYRDNVGWYDGAFSETRGSNS